MLTLFYPYILPILPRKLTTWDLLLLSLIHTFSKTPARTVLINHSPHWERFPVGGYLSSCRHCRVCGVCGGEVGGVCCRWSRVITRMLCRLRPDQPMADGVGLVLPRTHIHTYAHMTMGWFVSIDWYEMRVRRLPDTGQLSRSSKRASRQVSTREVTVGLKGSWWVSTCVRAKDTQARAKGVGQLVWFGGRLFWTRVKGNMRLSGLWVR